MTPEVKGEISKAALDLAKYVHDGEFAEIIVSGGSNQLSRSLLTLAWQSEYKGEPMPKIMVIDAHANSSLYKSGVDSSAEKENIEKWVADNLSLIEEIKNRKVCLVDDFAFSGGKYIFLKKRFEQLGFSNLKFAFFAATSVSEIGRDVFVGTLDLEAFKELHGLSQKIKGNPSLPEIQAEMELSSKENRGQALGVLKEVGQKMRLK
ncbi:MAG: hypothetical protein KBD17_00140 [Candidatus Pacebacteria bacterium]|nr:hypothetical protein [Candidatus Paceibacterota bacterium]